MQLREGGARQFELDIQYQYALNTFEVYHIKNVDEGTRCRKLADCLSTLKAWSDENPAHQPIFVQIEIKDAVPASDAEAYFARLEGAALAVWPRERILAPDDVRASAATLREGIVMKGWPTLGATRGKIVFFLDVGGEVRASYTRGGEGINGRLMFIDSAPSDPWAGILLANDPVGDALRIEESVKAGLLVRTRADADNVEPLAGETTRRDRALESGAHFVSTDYPMEVEGVDYVVELLGGTPSRCNPITAPAECTSLAIEDPAFMH